MGLSSANDADATSTGRMTNILTADLCDAEGDPRDDVVVVPSGVEDQFKGLGAANPVGCLRQHHLPPRSQGFEYVPKSSEREPAVVGVELGRTPAPPLVARDLDHLNAVAGVPGDAPDLDKLAGG